MLLLQDQPYTAPPWIEWKIGGDLHVSIPRRQKAAVTRYGFLGPATGRMNGYTRPARPPIANHIQPDLLSRIPFVCYSPWYKPLLHLSPNISSPKDVHINVRLKYTQVSSYGLPFWHVARWLFMRWSPCMHLEPGGGVLEVAINWIWRTFYRK